MVDQAIQSAISNVIPSFEWAGEPATYPHIDHVIATKVSRIMSSSGDRDGSKRPRIYILLHYLRLTRYHTAFSGHSDDHLPFVDWTLPEELDENARQKFLKWQDLVIPRENRLFVSKVKPHMEFKDENGCRLLHIKVLGHGAWGVVESVRGESSQRVFARKKFLFKGRNQHIRRVLDSFKRELQALKRLHHHHLIMYVGSYEDPSGTSLVMLPVAECDLSVWMQESSDTAAVRRFFGCLASALAFLHQEKIRHKDIKPSNVLVHKSRVLLSDFGSSLDWKEWGMSTTSGNMEAGTRVYAAPEAFEHERRGSSSDIFSLGCVFLELATKLCGHIYDDLYQHLKENGTGVILYGDNEEGIRSWVKELKKPQRTVAELKLLRIILSMLGTDRMRRPKASTVAGDIHDLGDEFSCNHCHVERLTRDLDIDLQEPEQRGLALCKVARQGNVRDFEFLLSITDNHHIETVADTTLNDSIKFNNFSIAETTLSYCQRRGISLDIHLALHQTVGAGDSRGVKLLMEYGADANAMRETDPTWRSSLYMAASWGHDQIIETMISCGVDLNRKEQRDGKTVLHAAFRGNLHGRLLGLILSQNPDVNAGDAEGITPLLVALDSRGTFPHFLGQLLRAGADPNKPDKSGETPLFHACKKDKPWQVELAKILIKEGADIHYSVRPSRDTPLHVAAAHGNTRMVLLLLENGAHIEAKNSFDETPFQLAASHGDLHLMKHLLDRGASTRTKSDDQYTELISAASCGRVANVSGWTQIAGPTVLRRALAQGDLTAVHILLACGFEMETGKNEKESELFKKILERRTELASSLIQTGCEAEKGDGQGTTTLLMAAFMDYTELAKELIESGVPLEARNKFGSTALSIAALHGNTELVELLLDAGANIENKDEEGWSPLFNAAHEGEIETAKLLVDKGARILEIYQNVQLCRPNNFFSARQVLEEMKEYSMSSSSSSIAWFA